MDKPKPQTMPIMRRDPLTGQMVEYVPRGMRTHDAVSPAPLPEPQAVSEKARVAQELADIRAEYTALTSAKRCGVTGDKLCKRYRKLSLEHWHLTGNHPPPIHADL